MGHQYWDFVLEKVWIYYYPHNPLNKEMARQILEYKNSVYIGADDAK